MDELRDVIAKAIADTSEHSACDWDWCVPENKASFLDYADIALRAIDGAGYRIVEGGRWKRIHDSELGYANYWDSLSRVGLQDGDLDERLQSDG